MTTETTSPTLRALRKIADEHGLDFDAALLKAVERIQTNDRPMTTPETTPPTAPTMTTQTDETAPSPAIPEAALMAALDTFFVDVNLPPYDELPRIYHTNVRDSMRAALLAALPHLRDVQAAPPPPDMTHRDPSLPARNPRLPPPGRPNIVVRTPYPFAIKDATRPAPASPAPAAPIESKKPIRTPLLGYNDGDGGMR